MSLKKIISISGLPGLFRVIAQTKNSSIVESMIDKKRFPVGANQQVSSLEDVSIFTTGDDKKLTEIFKAMKQMPEADTVLDANADGATLKTAFKKIVPDYDEERVYASDIKKVFKWYQFVKDMLNEEEEETKDSGTEKPADENVTDKTKE